MQHHHTYARYLLAKSGLLVLLWLTVNFAWAQDEPEYPLDLGDAITICHGTTGTRTISLLNKEAYEGAFAEPITYTWYIASEGTYQVLSRDVIEHLSNLEDFILDLSICGSASSIKLQLMGSDGVYKRGNKDIIVQRPVLTVPENIQCENSSVPLSVAICDDGQGASYSYSFVYADPTSAEYLQPVNGTQLSQDQNAALFITPDYAFSESRTDQSVLIMAQVQNLNTGDIQQSATQTVSIMNLGSPALPSHTYLCDGVAELNPQLNDIATTGLKYSWYQYSPESEEITEVSIEQEPGPHAFNSPGFYMTMVYRTDGNRCAKFTNMCQLKQLEAIPSIMSDRTNLDFPGDQIILMALNVPEDGSLQWYRYDQSIDLVTLLEGETGTTYTATQAGYYFMITGMCSEPSNVITISANSTLSDPGNPIDPPIEPGPDSFTGTTGIQDNSADFSVQFYPNPINKNGMLRCTNPAYWNKKAQFQVMDIRGKVVADKEILLDKEVPCDFSSFTPGNYFIRVSIKGTSMYSIKKVEIVK